MKGSMFDVLYMAILALVMSVGIIIAAVVMTNIQTSTAASFASPEAVNIMAKGVESVRVFNYTFILIIGSVMFAGVIGAFLIPSHPIMIVPAVVLLVVFMVAIPILSNTYETVSANTEFTTEVTNFGLISFTMGNLPIISVVFGALLIVAMYTRFQSSGTI